MNNIDTSQLLSQLRMAAAQARNQTPAAETVQAPGDKFSSLLLESINKVNSLQQTSGQLQDSFQLGREGVSLTDVMIAKGKASIAFEGMVQVRNKVVDAYQEIMRMQV